MGLAIKVQIVSATDVGGQYPFVVVCFDGDITRELYKTDAVAGGKSAVWNHDFELDLTAAVKGLVADGKPEPTYLTFFLFDTGAPNVPSLGSAGVLLATVRDSGRAQGDFPVVNGNGTLRLVVTSAKTRHGVADWSTGQKVAGVAGVTALAAGITALAVNQHKKKKKKKAGEATRGLGGDAEEQDAHPDSAGQGPAARIRSWWEGSESSSSSEEEDGNEDYPPAQQGYPQASREAPDEGDAAEEDEE